MRAIALAALTIIALTGCRSTTTSQVSPNAVLVKYGYLQQVPPVAAHGPGSLVWRRPIPQPAERYASLGYICEPRFTVDPSEPIRSPTESTDLGRDLNANFELAGAELANFGLGVSAQYIDKVHLTLSNVEIHEYPLETLERIRSSLGPSCRNILKKQVSRQNAYQVVSVLKADVAYNVEFNSGVSASAKEQALTAIGLKLGLGRDGTDGVVGKGLYYGVAMEPQTSI